jgi:heme-degrading monooxygenase HmoA
MEVFRVSRSRARYVVVFESVRPESPSDDDGYAAVAEAMEALARTMPGFVDVESVRGADGRGITVSYWESLEAIAAWRDHPAHAAARERGRDGWYRGYRLSVARLERSAEGGPAFARSRIGT